MIIGNAIPWSEEDLSIIKEKGQYLSIEEIINLLSVKRTHKAIQHKLSKFGIHRKQKVIQNYDNIKYKYIDGIEHKLCKQCERYLPCTYDYFSEDIHGTTTGLRNVCRECKSELFRINSNVYRWTEYDVNIMIKYYSDLTNSELINNFLPHLDSDRIIKKANRLGLYKSQEALDRSAQEVGDFHAVRLSLLNKWQGEDNPMYNSQRFGELNPNYKGGIKSLSSYLRDKMKPWVLDSLRYNNFKCVITNIEDHKLVVHHLYSFKKIIDETLNILNIPLYFQISLYSIKQLCTLENKCLELHYEKGLGLPIIRPLHKLFHSWAGNLIIDSGEFEEFKGRYYNFEFDDLLDNKYRYSNILKEVG